MVVDRYYYREHRMVWLLLLFLAGLLLMMPWLETAPSVLAADTGKTVTIAGTVRESRDGQNYLWLKLDRQKEMLYVSLPRNREAENDTAIWYPTGTRLQIHGLLELPQGQRNPGGFDEAQWLRSKQARIKIMADEIVVLQEPQGIWRLSWQMQCWLKKTARQVLAPEQEGLAMALLLGEKQQLEQEFYRLSQRMGIAHMFAVSGLHVGFAGTLLLFVFRLLGMERNWLSFVCLMAVLGFYCILTGLPPSAVRAAVMLLLAALATRLLRPPAPVDFLALAAVLLLFDNPFLVFAAGFQLSFGVTLALLLFVKPLQKKLQWVRWLWLRDSLAVAGAAYLGSLPLTAWHFYTLSFLSPLFNLLLVPVVSIAVPAMLLAFLCTALLPAGGNFFFLPVTVLLKFLLQGTTLLSDWIGTGHWYIGRPGWMAMLCYLLFLFFLWRWLYRKKEAETSARNTAAVCLTAAVLLCIPAPPDGDELLYLDAGQGSSAILRTEQGETVIFDGGTQERELASCLAWYGVNEVQAMVLSHGDADHIGGVMQVLEQIPVRYLCMEYSQMQREAVQPLLELAREQGAAIKPVAAGAALALQNGEVRLYAVADGSTGTNSRALTAAVQIDAVTIAFPGDLSVQGAEAFVKMQQQITIWTVPHHGSRFSASASLYQMLRQKGVQLAVISAGQQNRYGHPHEDVLQLLQNAGIPVHRTDRQGAVRISLGSFSAPAE